MFYPTFTIFAKIDDKTLMNAQAQEKTTQMHWEKLITSKRFGMVRFSKTRNTYYFFNRFVLYATFEARIDADVLDDKKKK